MKDREEKPEKVRDRQDRAQPDGRQYRTADKEPGEPKLRPSDEHEDKDESDGEDLGDDA